MAQNDTEAVQAEAGADAPWKARYVYTEDIDLRNARECAMYVRGFGQAMIDLGHFGFTAHVMTDHLGAVLAGLTDDGFMVSTEPYFAPGVAKVVTDERQWQTRVRAWVNPATALQRA